MKRTSTIHRFVALTLALLMFTTSVGFAMDMHYCGGKVRSVSFLGKAKACIGMNEASTMKSCTYNPHQKNNGLEISKKPCCENKTVRFQLDQDRKVQSVDYTINTHLQQFVKAFVVTFFAILPVDQNTPSFALYKPPILPKDIPVLIQSFLL